MDLLAPIGVIAVMIGMIFLWVASVLATLAIPILLVYLIIKHARKPSPKPNDASTAPQTAKEIKPKSAVMVFVERLFGIGGCCVLFFWVGNAIIPEVGTPFVQIAVGGVVAPTALFSVFFIWHLLLKKEGRECLRLWCKHLRRFQPSHEFNVARHISASSSPVIRKEDLEWWQSGTTIAENDIRDVLAQTRSIFESITGFQDISTKRPRIIIFEEAKDFDAYASRLFGESRRLGGYFLHWPRPTIVMRLNKLDAPLRSWRGLLAHEYAHLLLHAKTGQTAPPWLNEGLACLTADRFEAHPLGDLRKAQSRRSIQYGIAKNEFYDWAEMQETKYGSIGGKPDAALEVDLSYFMRRQRFYLQSVLLLNHLANNHAEELQTYLEALRLSKKRKRLEPDDYFSPPLSEAVQTCLQLNKETQPPTLPRTPEMEQVLSNCQAALATQPPPSTIDQIEALSHIAHVLADSEGVLLSPFTESSNPIIAAYASRLVDLFSLVAVEEPDPEPKQPTKIQNDSK